MNASEYLIFLPLLFYGLALSNLLSQWKRLFYLETLYVPYAMYTILLTETALYNVYVYFDLIAALEYVSYYNYLIYLLPPFLFMLCIHIFTPDEGAETEEYFMKHVTKFSLMTALFIGSHFLFEFKEVDHAFFLRMAFILFLVLSAFFRKRWTHYAIFGFWLITFLMK